jgi:hypothetical protein
VVAGARASRRPPPGRSPAIWRFGGNKEEIRESACDLCLVFHSSLTAFLVKSKMKLVYEPHNLPGQNSFFQFFKNFEQKLHVDMYVCPFFIKSKLKIPSLSKK